MDATSGYSNADIQSLQYDLSQAATLLASNDPTDQAAAQTYIKSYYRAQVTFRGYASDALQVVDNVGLFGAVANREVMNAVGADAV